MSFWYPLRVEVTVPAMDRATWELSMRKADRLWMMIVIGSAVVTFILGRLTTSGTVELPPPSYESATADSPRAARVSEPVFPRKDRPSPIQQERSPADNSLGQGPEGLADGADQTLVTVSNRKISQELIVTFLTRLLDEEPNPALVDRTVELAEALLRDLLETMAVVEEAAARRIAAEVLREEALREDAERNGAMALLRSLKDRDIHPFEVMADPEVFDDLFERKTHGPLLHGTTWGEQDELQDGTVLSYPPGVHEWNPGAFLHRKRFPRDLLVEGAGMDATMLRFKANLSTRDEVHSLTFRDLTLDCANNSLTDLRREPITLRLDRCRIVRFDRGAGGSYMVDAKDTAFYATDCRIEGGYGRGRDGNLFRARGLLVRMDRCLIRGPVRDVYDTGDSSTYLFRECFFQDMYDRLKTTLEAPSSGVRFENCSFSYLPKDAPRLEAPRLLSEINPDW